MPVETRRSVVATAAATTITSASMKIKQTFTRAPSPTDDEEEQRALEEAAFQFACKHDLPIDSLRYEHDNTLIDVRNITPTSEDQVVEHAQDKIARQEEEAAAAAARQSPSSEDGMNTSSSEDCRKDEELEAIRHEIAELESEIDISKQYKVVDRLGEGECAPFLSPLSLFVLTATAVHLYRYLLVSLQSYRLQARLL